MKPLLNAAASRPGDDKATARHSRRLRASARPRTRHGTRTGERDGYESRGPPGGPLRLRSTLFRSAAHDTAHGSGPASHTSRQQHADATPAEPERGTRADAKRLRGTKCPKDTNSDRRHEAEGDLHTAGHRRRCAKRRKALTDRHKAEQRSCDADGLTGTDETQHTTPLRHQEPDKNSKHTRCAGRGGVRGGGG